KLPPDQQWGQYVINQLGPIFRAAGWKIAPCLPPAFNAVCIDDLYKYRWPIMHRAERCLDWFLDRRTINIRFEAGYGQRILGKRGAMVWKQKRLHIVIVIRDGL